MNISNNLPCKKATKQRGKMALSTLECSGLGMSLCLELLGLDCERVAAGRLGVIMDLSSWYVYIKKFCSFII